MDATFSCIKCNAQLSCGAERCPACDSAIVDGKTASYRVLLMREWASIAVFFAVIFALLQLGMALGQNIVGQILGVVFYVGLVIAALGFVRLTKGIPGSITRLALVRVVVPGHGIELSKVDATSWVAGKISLLTSLYSTWLQWQKVSEQTLGRFKADLLAEIKAQGKPALDALAGSFLTIEIGLHDDLKASIFAKKAELMIEVDEPSIVSELFERSEQLNETDVKRLQQSSLRSYSHSIFVKYKNESDVNGFMNYLFSSNPLSSEFAHQMLQVHGYEALDAKTVDYFRRMAESSDPAIKKTADRCLRKHAKKVAP